MKFTPKSESEIASDSLLAPGVYDFEVVAAEDKVSKNGNDMMALNLKVWDSAGKTHFVKDWLLEAFLKKLLEFCVETNLRGSYDDGTLQASDLIGKTGKVEIAIEEKGDYPAKNTVKRYGVKGAPKKASDPLPAPTPRKAAHEVFADDDIPF